jgi:peptide subunit release factor 1 (eRF1)
VERLHGSGIGAAVGAEEVMKAIDAGRVSRHSRLLLGPDPREVVWRCSACRFLSLESCEKCGRCGGECKESNLWEELLLRAMRHGWNVEAVESNTLGRLAGVALLSDGQAQRRPGRRGRQTPAPPVEIAGGS